MLGWLNEKIRIPHSNWSPYCEYQMKTFRNLSFAESFHLCPGKKKKSIYTAFSSSMFSLANIVFKTVVQTLHIMVDTMVGKIKKQKTKNKTASQIDIKPTDRKRKDTNVIWADSRADCFCCSFSPKQCDATLYIRRKSHFLIVPTHKHLYMWERQKEAAIGW